MKKDDREANIFDFEDRIEMMTENWASDLFREEGVPYNEGLKLAAIAIRRVARKGVKHLFIGIDKKLV